MSLNSAPALVRAQDFHRRLLVVFALACLGLVCAAARAEVTAPSPARLLQSNSDRVIRTLAERRTEFRSNPAALHAFVRGELSNTFDRTYAARLVLGSSVKEASDDDVRAFADALIDNLLDRYSPSLLKLNPVLNLKVASQASLRGGAIVKVMSVIMRSNGMPVSVDCLFHQNDGQWQVFDVIVEGISFVQTFRIVFAGDLHAKSLARITEDLRNDKMQVAPISLDASPGKH